MSGRPSCGCGVGTALFVVTTLAGNWTATWFYLIGGGLRPKR